MTKSQILKAYKKPFRYDEMGQFIFDADNHMVAEIRGWGRIKYMDKAVEIQDGIGEEISSLLNAIPEGSRVNFNGMRKSMVQNFNRVLAQLERKGPQDDNLKRYLSDLRGDIAGFICCFEPGDDLFRDLSETLLPILRDVYEEDKEEKEIIPMDDES